MRKKKVRCHHANAGLRGEEDESVYFTVPDFGDSIQLYSCLKCGEIFCVDSEQGHYSGKPMKAVIAGLKCPKCMSKLETTLKLYPKNFLSVSGSVCNFTPKREIPPDSESVIKEFWDLHSAIS